MTDPLIDIESATRRVAADLTELHLGHALVGGLAVSMRTLPRFTKDLDLAVAVDDDGTAEAAIRELLRLGYGIRSTVEHEASGRLATVRLVTPKIQFGTDLLFASSGIETEIVADGEPMEVFPGVWMLVARTGHLVAIKLLARDDDARPQDLLDLRALSKAADEVEIVRARHAVELITERGYNRDRDLTAALDELVGG